MAINTFDPDYYASQYPDVTAALAQGQFTSYQQHFELFGARELQNPNADFDSQYYAANNVDALEAVAAGNFSSVYDHYLKFGVTENRFPDAALASFDEAAYLAANADVAAAVSSGAFTSGLEHFVLFGKDEIMDPDNTGRSSSGVPEDALIDPTTVGETYVLTAGFDDITGTDKNDTITGDFASTVQVTDKIAGGGGTDTLMLFGAFDAAKVPSNLTGVETVELASALANADLDLSASFTGVESIVVSDAALLGGKSITLDSGQSLSLATGATNLKTAGVVTVAHSATDTSATLTLDGYQGKDTAANAQALTATGAAVTSYTLKSTGAANQTSILTLPGTATAVTIDAATSLTAGSLVASAATAVTITGAGDVAITSSAALAAAPTVDASAATGDVSFTDKAAGSTLTFKGGSGDDSVTFAAGKFTTDDTLTGGEGIDSIVIKDTTPVYDAINAASGFEQLVLAATGATVDVSQVTGIKSFKVGAGNFTETFSNATATDNFTIDNSTGNTGTVTINPILGQNTVSVSLDAGAAGSNKTLAALKVSSATAVSLESTGSGDGGNVITTLTNADNSTITVTGDKDLIISNALSGTSTGSVVDASTFTGALTVTGSGKGNSLIGGASADTLTGGDGADLITGGAGADLITGGKGADTLTGGDGADTFVATTLTDVLDGEAITDFVSGADQLKVGGAIDGNVAADLTVSEVAWNTDLNTTIGTTVAKNDAALVKITGAAAGSYEDKVFLVLNDGTLAFSTTADGFIELTGVTTLTPDDFIT